MSRDARLSPFLLFTAKKPLMKKIVPGVLVLLVALASLWAVWRHLLFPDHQATPPPPVSHPQEQALPPSTESESPATTPKSDPSPTQPPAGETVASPPSEADDAQVVAAESTPREDLEKGQAADNANPPASVDDHPTPPGMGLLTDTGETEENRIDDPRAAMVRASAVSKGRNRPVAVERQTVAVATTPPRQVEPKSTSGDLPYSVLLETFDNPDNAKKGVALHAQKGITAYAVKVDLGAAGIKYRLFCGTFATERAARSFIDARSLRGKPVKNTPYTAVIGVFNDRQELSETTEKAKAAGVFPYVLGTENGPSQLVVGAFYTRDGAERQCQELVFAGLSCTAGHRSTSLTQ